MGLETVFHIDDLVTTNPLDSDDPTQGAAHIRNIKRVLQGDFFNISGTVGATQSELNILDGATLSTTELNYVDGVTSPIQTQLNALSAGVNVFQGFKATAQQIITTAAQVAINTTNFTNLTEDFDTDLWFNPVTGVFQPDEAGYYEFKLTARGFDLAVSLSGYVYKNGLITEDYIQVGASATGLAGVMLSATHNMNGTTDYADFRLDSGADAAWSAGVVITARKVGT